VIEKTITIFRNKKPKKPKIWTLGFLVFFEKPRNLGFLKATSYSPDHHSHKEREEEENCDITCAYPRSRSFIRKLVKS